MVRVWRGEGGGGGGEGGVEVGGGSTKGQCVCGCVFVGVCAWLCVCVCVWVCLRVCVYVCVPDIHKLFHTRPAAQQRGQECVIDRPSCRAHREVSAASAEIEHVLVGVGDFRGETTGHSTVIMIQHGLTRCAGLGRGVY